MLHTNMILVHMNKLKDIYISKGALKSVAWPHARIYFSELITDDSRGYQLQNVMGFKIVMESAIKRNSKRDWGVYYAELQQLIPDHIRLTIFKDFGDWGKLACFWIHGAMIKELGLIPVAGK